MMSMTRVTLAFLLTLGLMKVTAAYGQANQTYGLDGEPGLPVVPINQDTGSPVLDGSDLSLPDNVEIPDLSRTYGSAVTLPSIFVKAIVLEGNTLLAQANVDLALEPFVGTELTFEDLQKAGSALTRLYIDRGYVSSGVIVPDQQVDDGVVRMVAVEGGLTSIEVSGNDNLRESYIETRLRRDLGPHLNVFELEESLRIMQQSPLIGQVNARVLPGAQRGDSILDLKVRERDAIILRAGYDNHRSPSIGEDQGKFSLAHNSLTGNGDYLLFNYALTDGLDDISAAYGIPLTAGDLTAEIYYSEGDSDIVEAPFDELDIVSEVTTGGLRFYRPFIRTLNHSVVLGFGFENTETESFLLAAPFSFSPGEQLGESAVSLLNFTADWTWRRPADAISLRGSLRWGVDWLDATDNSRAMTENGEAIKDLPDSDFTAVMIQSSYARLLPWRGMQLLGRFTGQAASDPLLSSQKIAVGGARTVRGYRENQLVRDNGVIASLELRIPVFPDETNQSRWGLTFAPFFDYGWARDESIDLPGLEDPESDDLMSIGAGLIWNWWKPFYLEVYYGEDLEDLDNSGDSLQEDGWHIQTYLEWAF